MSFEVISIKDKSTLRLNIHFDIIKSIFYFLEPKKFFLLQDMITHVKHEIFGRMTQKIQKVTCMQCKRQRRVTISIYSSFWSFVKLCWEQAIGLYHRPKEYATTHAQGSEIRRIKLLAYWIGKRSKNIYRQPFWTDCSFEIYQLHTELQNEEASEEEEQAQSSSTAPCMYHAAITAIREMTVKLVFYSISRTRLSFQEFLKLQQECFSVWWEFIHSLYAQITADQI